MTAIRKINEYITALLARDVDYSGSHVQREKYNNINAKLFTNVSSSPLQLKQNTCNFTNSYCVM